MEHGLCNGIGVRWFNYKGTGGESRDAGVRSEDWSEKPELLAVEQRVSDGETVASGCGIVVSGGAAGSSGGSSGDVSGEMGKPAAVLGTQVVETGSLGGETGLSPWHFPLCAFEGSGCA